MLSGTSRDKSAAMRIRMNRRHCRARLIKDFPSVAVADEADKFRGRARPATNLMIDNGQPATALKDVR